MLLFDLDWSNNGGGELPVELDGDRDRPLTGSVAGEKVNGTAGEGDAVPLT